MKEETEAVEPDEVIEEERGIALRRPNIPTNVNELAALEKNVGKAIVDNRTEILETLRTASIRLTAPRDWTLYKTPDGVVTGFLDDSGCDRVKKLWAVQIKNLSPMERIPREGTAEDGAYAYSITADGHCGMTGESVFEMEGVRYSNERYAEEKPEGIQREVAVRKAARANLDGGIVRELTGLKNVPVEELETTWKGTWKKTDLCNRGRGFGSRDTRMGVGDDKTGDIDPADIPICEVCKVKLVFRPAKKFFGCPSYQKHPDKKVIIQLADLQREIADRKKAMEPREPGADDK